MRTTAMTTVRRIVPLAAVALFVGCQAKVDLPKFTTGPERSSSRKDPARMSASDLQQFVSTNAAIAGADSVAVQTTLPTGPIVKEPEPVKTTPVITVNPSIVVPAMMVANATESRSRPANVMIAIPKVRSNYFETEKDAKYNALQVAAQEINVKLQSLDSPVAISLTPNRVWNEFVVKDSGRLVQLTPAEKEALDDSKAGADRIRYELDVEITDTQVKQLRGEDRLWSIAPFAGAGLVLAAIGNLFFRLGGLFGKKAV